mmetsp:Transcript_30798/g.88965  ORF Transcript_30798/g.88965 Transcript_30798/m.88965 type:complete len:398 (+) Transcript_30798:56-1249(+)
MHSKFARKGSDGDMQRCSSPLGLGGRAGSGALPVKNTFIHFPREAESPERTKKDASWYPRGSLTLSPNLPRMDRAAEHDEPGMVTPRGQRSCAHDRIPDTPEAAPPVMPDYTLEQLASLPKWPVSLASSSVSAAPPPPMPAWPLPHQNHQRGPQHTECSGRSRPPSMPERPQAKARPFTAQSQSAQSDHQTGWVDLSSFGAGELGGYMFKFTLRRADGTVLGLAVEKENEDRALLVTKVNSGGAVEAWNKQCNDGPMYWKAVAPGDRIVQANNALGCDAILGEIRDKHLLQLVIVREIPSQSQTLHWSDIAPMYMPNPPAEYCDTGFGGAEGSIAACGGHQPGLWGHGGGLDNGMMIVPVDGFAGLFDQLVDTHAGAAHQVHIGSQPRQLGLQALLP